MVDKKILFLAFDFPPKGGAGVYRSLKFTKYLPRFGWTPTVLALEPDLKGSVFRDDTLLIDIPKGVEVIRIPFPNSLHKAVREKQGVIPSILRSYFLVWPDVSSPWMRKAVAQGIRKCVRKRHQAIYASILPLSSGLAGVKLSRLLNLPLITDFRDTVSTTPMYDFPCKVHWHIARHYENRIFSRSSKIIMNTPVAEKEMKTRYPAWTDKILHIPNGYDEEDFIGIKPKRNAAKFRFVYCGSYNLGGSAPSSLRNPPAPGIRGFLKSLQFTERPMDRTTQAPNYFFDALCRIRQESPDVYQSLEVLFIGGRRGHIENEARKRNLQDVVRSLGHLPHKEALAYQVGADGLLLTLLRPLDAHPLSAVPGKTYEYLRSYRPILALTPSSDTRDLVIKSKLGIQVSQTDSADIAQAVKVLVAKGKERRLAPDTAFIGRFSRKRLTEKLANLLEEVSR